MITGSFVSGQTTSEINPINPRALLKELGDMLKEVPKTEQDCQELLKKIRTWHESKVKEIEVPKAELSIIEPRNGDKVPERPYISGRVADPNLEVWVIVHPMEVSDYWVQPRVTVRGDGSWKVSIYIGRPGNIDVGKRFEIMAIANPKSKLNEGMVIRGWPDAKWRSEVIEVIRK